VSFLPIGAVSHAAVALYLGLEMLSHLDGDRTGATLLFEQLARLVPVLDVICVPAKTTDKDKGGTQ
jgi:hypothetical protein